ncbi:hypothetical protein H6770_04265 [Candidatus Peribacteria bacterium]|nr:hypothetical protein [Candidatus Peribacteria bacterium]
MSVEAPAVDVSTLELPETVAEAYMFSSILMGSSEMRQKLFQLSSAEPVSYFEFLAGKNRFFELFMHVAPELTLESDDAKLAERMLEIAKTA